MSISIGRDHEFRHILYAQSGSHHVLFCSVCDSEQDTHGDWMSWMAKHRECRVVVASVSPDASPETVKALGEMAALAASSNLGPRHPAEHRD